MCNGNCCTGLHETLECLLNKTLALGIECRCCLIENKDRRILEDCTGNAYALTLTAREKTTTVTYIGIIAILGLHNEIVGIGNLGSLDNLLHCGVLDTKGDVVVECIVEQNCLLIHITDESAQGFHLHILDIYAVNGYLALVDIVVTWNEVDHGRLSATRLANKSYSLALAYLEVDVLEDIALAIV